MRKILILLSVLALSVGTFASAEAAKTSRKFSISAYSDNRKMDLDSSSGGNRTTTIKGKVRGGKVKGGSVAIYVTNIHTRAQSRRYLGRAKLSSKGAFKKAFAPSEGGTYRVEIVKKGKGGRLGAVKTIVAHAYEWPILSAFYDETASSSPDPSVAAALVSRSDKEQTGNGTAPNERWSTSYAIHGTGKAVFNITGYNCWRFNLKLAVSKDSRAGGGTFQITQGSRVLASQTMHKGDRFWEPSRSLSESIDPDLPLIVSIAPESGAADPTAVRFVLGNPKASCTYPQKSTPYL